MLRPSASFVSSISSSPSTVGGLVRGTLLHVFDYVIEQRPLVNIELDHSDAVEPWIERANLSAKQTLERVLVGGYYALSCVELMRPQGCHMGLDGDV